MRIRVLGLTLLLLALASCGDESSQPQSPDAPVAPAGGAAHAGNGTFDVAVLVGPTARTPSRAEIERVFARAAETMAGKTGERMRLTDVLFDAASARPTEAAAAYLRSRSANPPEGIVVLSEDDTARAAGGYSTVVTPPFTYRSEFSSPRDGVGSNKVYVAVVHFDHAYASCGYDDAGNRISAVSVGGECRNRPGTPCVARGDRFMCADAVGDLYAQPDAFAASTFVHEFLHPFGIDANGNLDHYGSSACLQRGGMPSDQGPDIRDAQLSVGMCPDVFPRFRRTP